MTRRIILSLFLILSASTIQAQEAPNAETRTTDSLNRQYIVADEVAAVVGNSAILLSDIENMALYIVALRKQEGTLSKQTEREEAFELLLTQHLLATKARMDSLEKDMNSIDGDVEREVQRMITAAGGIAALESRQGKPIYQIKADVTIDIKQSKLAQAMDHKVRSSAKVSQDEVRQYVSKLAPEDRELIPVQYMYSQIVKAPEQTDERRYAIRERLLEFRKRILAGEISLGALANMYSADIGSARRRGEMGPQHINTFVGAFTDALKSLKPGEVSEIVETEYGYHLIELISYQDGPDTRLYPQVVIRHILLKPEFTVEESRQVENELDSLTKEIQSGGITFEAAAMRFSDDELTRENGGKAYNKLEYDRTGNIRGTSSRFKPDELMPEDYRYLSSLKLGEISTPFETMDSKGNTVYKIVRLDRIIDAHAANVDEDFDVLEIDALKDKENKVVDAWIDQTIDKVYIEIKPNYLTYKFNRPGWKVAAERSAVGKNIKISNTPRVFDQPVKDGSK